MHPDDCLLDVPDAPIAWLVFAHGAGAGMRHEWMNEISARLVAHKIAVLRFEFPYMQKRGRGPPDRAPVLIEAWHEAACLGASLAGGFDRLFIGGKSMGGRYATMIAESLSSLCGVVAFGYPFHPPGKDTLRIAHLQELSVPTLILQGERDAFGSRDEVNAYQLPVEVHFLVDGDHSLSPRKSSGRTLESNLEEAAGKTADFMRRVLAAVDRSA